MILQRHKLKLLLLNCFRNIILKSITKPRIDFFVTKIGSVSQYFVCFYFLENFNMFENCWVFEKPKKKKEFKVLFCWRKYIG